MGLVASLLPAPSLAESVTPLPIKADVVVIEPSGTTPSSARALAKIVSRNRGWHKGSEWSCLKQLWSKESAWNYRADNPHSSAYGIAQMLNTPTHWSPRKQINKGLHYIQNRYGTPCKAWQHFKTHHWY